VVFELQSQGFVSDEHDLLALKLLLRTAASALTKALTKLTGLLGSHNIALTDLPNTLEFHNKTSGSLF
jgi:hypothetical protein